MSGQTEARAAGSADLRDLFSYVDEHFDASLEELFRLIRQPSISAQDTGMTECAELLAGMMTEHSIRTSILPTGGYPVVYGEIGPDHGPTLLVYGHYDVQPPEPLDQWVSPPFEPTIRGDRIYARGIADDKGQFYTAIAAAGAWHKVRGESPVRVKYIFEGEEEIGSPHLADFLRAERERLAGDVFVFLDTNIHPAEIPLLTLGLKGMTYVELVAHGPKIDVGCALDPVVPNPAWRLAWALGTIKAPDGRILIDGFYDDVRENTPAELEAIAEIERRVPTDTQALLDHYGLDELLGGIDGPEAQRRQMLQPTCSIDGIWGGYGGPGVKTVLPSTASAKLAMRLVPDQRAEDIYDKLVRHLERHGFGDIEVRKLGFLQPCRTPLDNPWVGVVKEAMHLAYGVEPLVAPSVMTGGSGPDEVFASILNVPTIGLPCAQFKDKNAHAPNESMTIESVRRGIKTNAALIACMAERAKES